jgi:hypothetical protein
MRWTAERAMKLPRDWLEELELLAWRFAHFGFGPDLGSMFACEVVGLYAYLARLAAIDR